MSEIHSLEPRVTAPRFTNYRVSWCRIYRTSPLFPNSWLNPPRFIVHPDLPYYFPILIPQRQGKSGFYCKYNKKEKYFKILSYLTYLISNFLKLFLTINLVSKLSPIWQVSCFSWFYQNIRFKDQNKKVLFFGIWTLKIL